MALTTASGQSVNRAFTDEAANASRINHPSIVRIWDVGEHDGTHYMASELVIGKNLSEIASERSLDDRACVQIVADIADGIEAAHRCGVIHRDLKPSNIMLECDTEETDVVDDQGTATASEYSPETHRVRILDFGVAKMLDRLTRRTVMGDVIGTPHYMSPEQASGNSINVDGRSDIFSLGVILFELLSGRLPFEGTEIAVTTSIRDLKAPSISSVRPDTPAPLATIVSKCLEREPHRRYQTAALLEEDLRNWLTGKQTRAVIQLHREQWIQFGKVATAIVAVFLVVLFTVNYWPKSTNDLGSKGGVERRIVERPVEASLKQWCDEGVPSALLEVVQNTNVLESELDRLVAESLESTELDDAKKSRVRLVRFLHRPDSEIDGPELFSHSWEWLKVGTDEEWGNTLSVLPENCLSLWISKISKAPSGRRERVFAVALKACELTQNAIAIRQLLQLSTGDEVSKAVAATIRSAKFSKPSEVELLPWLHEQFASTAPANFMSGLVGDSVAQWRGKLGLLAYGIEDFETVDALLAFATDPSPRSYFIMWFPECDLPIDPLLKRFHQYQDDWQSAAVIACLSTQVVSTIPRSVYSDAVEMLSNAYANHPSYSVHSGVRKLLEAWGRSDAIAAVESKSDFSQIVPSRNWFINSFGMQMNIVRAPIRFWVGSPVDNSTSYQLSQKGKLFVIENSFAFSDHLVKEGVYCQFDPNATPIRPSPEREKAVQWKQGINFMRWLSLQDGLVGESDEVAVVEELPDEEYVYNEPQRGYRYPRYDEWECFARAGTKSAFVYGEQKTLYESALLNSNVSLLGSYGPRFDDGVMSNRSEWTSSTRPLFFLGKEETVRSNINGVIYKGGFLPTQNTRIPSFEYGINALKKEGSDYYYIRLFRTISDASQ